MLLDIQRLSECSARPMHFHTIARADLRGPEESGPHLPTPLRGSWLGRRASIRLHDQISVGIVIMGGSGATGVLHLGALLLSWVSCVCFLTTNPTERSLSPSGFKLLRSSQCIFKRLGYADSLPHTCTATFLWAGGRCAAPPSSFSEHLG